MTIKKCEISCWSLGLLPIFAYAGKRQKIAREAGQRARRWVVERTHSWLNRFRRILVRWEKKAENYIALLHFACALIALGSHPLRYW